MAQGHILSISENYIYVWWIAHSHMLNLSENYIYVRWMAHNHMLSLSELHLCVVNGPQSHAEPLRELHLFVVNGPQSHAEHLRELHLCVVNGPQSHAEHLRTTSMRGEWPTITCWASQRTTSMCGEWPTVTCWASQNYIYVWWMAHNHMLSLSELHLCVVNGPQSHAEHLRTTSMCGEWPTVKCWASQNYIYVWWMAHSQMLSISELHLCVVNDPQSNAEPLRTTSMCGEWPTVPCWASQNYIYVWWMAHSHMLSISELHLCVVNGPQSNAEHLRTTSMCGEWPTVTCWASQNYIYVWWMTHSQMLSISELHLYVVNGP